MQRMQRIRRIAPALCLSMLTACASSQTSTSDAGMPSSIGTTGFAVDHIIVAIDTLERGIAMLRDATGLTPVFGGVHPGRGTQNALLSLGSGSYLELLAPNPSDAAGPQMVAGFASAGMLTPMGWALRAQDADSVRLLAISRGLPGGAVAPGSRARSDGSMLRWRTVTPWGSNLPLLPFFIEWQSRPHPSESSPAGCTLATMALGSTSSDSLRGLLDRLGVQVRVEPAARDVMRVVLDCPRGRVELPPPAR